VFVCLLGTTTGALAQSGDGKQRAIALMNRTVMVTAREAPGAAGEQGRGFIVGETVDARGRPVYLVVTADHVVRDKEDPDQVYPPPHVTLYAHQDQPQQAVLLNLRVPPEQGDLAILEVPKLAGDSLKPANMAPVSDLVPGMSAWRIGKLGVWLPSTNPGQYLGRDGVFLRFDGLDTPRGSSGAPVVTDKGVIGMVVLDAGSGSGESRVLPIDLIAAKFQEFKLPWDLSLDATVIVPPTAPTSLVGEWKNVDANTRGLTRLSVASGPDVVHAWGRCHPSDCDWGAMPASRFSNSVAGGNVAALRAVFKPSFAERTITIITSGLNMIDVEIFTHFTDNSGRADYSERDKFMRSGVTP